MMIVIIMIDKNDSENRDDNSNDDNDNNSTNSNNTAYNSCMYRYTYPSNPYVRRLVQFICISQIRQAGLEQSTPERLGATS